MNRFWERNKTYINVIFYIGFGLSAINALFGFTRELFNSTGVWDFIINFIFGAAMMGIQIGLGGLLAFAVIFLLTVVPYLIVRGFIK